ncbi:MAG TPA: CxxC-x17-CxxC domain-containing protein [Nitrosopumilaceae archaeon]|nr:CxxC-x17-CxxC domain-containing protein [Nitrosopumilaceae archaeon]
MDLHEVKTGKNTFGNKIRDISSSTSKSFRNSRDDRGSRDSRREESTTVTCSDCGTECQVPFVPKTDRPVYCSDCFRKNKPQDSENDRGSRYSSDDRGSRYSSDDRGSRYSSDDRGSRYSSDNRGSRDSRREESTTVTCSDCGTECQVPFVPRNNKPVYCSDCFRQHKPQDSENDRGSRYSSDNRGSRYSRDDRGSRYSRDDRGSRDNRREESTTVTCSDCGTECQVPFVPRNNKPVYCSDCFRQHKPQDSENDRGSRYSSDDRGSRNFNNRDSRSSRDSYSEKRPKTGKFLKKQESFYSGGSEKFYGALKEKLFEILGGKVCSNCGFKDERALGFGHIHDENTFDDVRRGGSASSWGKYISDPQLAKNELKILCLNCNELKKPSSPPEKKTGDFKKKNNRFPR